MHDVPALQGKIKRKGRNLVDPAHLTWFFCALSHFLIPGDVLEIGIVGVVVRRDREGGRNDRKTKKKRRRLRVGRILRRGMGTTLGKLEESVTTFGLVLFALSFEIDDSFLLEL